MGPSKRRMHREREPQAAFAGGGHQRILRGHPCHQGHQL